MLETIWEWRFVIAASIAAVIYGIMEWQKTKSTIYALMLQAKRMAKDAILNSGQEQEDWVVRKTLQFMPLSTSLFFNESMVRKSVKYLFSKLKDYLDDGEVDSSQ